ncbi:hypothetical protein LCGC14_0455250 [marine sediment metagenome]|uniref:Uncharacterized protein n=1 Tax=marine sediment metagenome TaxID=412755 RepID=A0A0F9V3H2_9ZZZZ
MNFTKERPDNLEQTQMSWEALIALLPSIAHHEGPNIRSGGVRDETVNYLCELSQAFTINFVNYNWGEEKFLNPIEREEEKNDENFIKETNTEPHISRHSPSICSQVFGGNDPVPGSRDDIGNIRSRNPEGPPGSFGNEGRVRNPNRAADQVDDNGPAGGGEEHPTQQQPAPPVPGPGERGGYVSGPSSTEVHTPSDDGPKRAGSSVPNIR